MSKRSKENKPEPKVGDNVTEPLSKQEIEQREAEAKKDNPKSAEATEPGEEKTEVSKPSLYPKKSSKEPKESSKKSTEEKIEEEIVDDEAAKLEAQKLDLLAAEVIAEEHAKIAKQNGYTAIASNLAGIAAMLKQLKKQLNNTDYLVKKAKIV